MNKDKNFKSGTSYSYDIGVLVGNSTFEFYEFMTLGKIHLAKSKAVYVKGKILDFAQDQ